MSTEGIGTGNELLKILFLHNPSTDTPICTFSRAVKSENYKCQMKISNTFISNILSQDYAVGIAPIVFMDFFIFEKVYPVFVFFSFIYPLFLSLSGLLSVFTFAC